MNKQKQVNPFEQWQRVKDAYPAIISYEEADRIFQKTESKKSSPTGNNKGLVRSSKYLLTGLIICPICGKHFVMNSDLKRNQFHYICGTRNRLAQGCENKIWIHQQYFEDQLMAQIEEVVLKDGPLEVYLQKCQQEYQKQQEEASQQLVSVKKQIEATEYRLDNLLNALADNLLPAEAIRDKYGREEIKKRQLEHRLLELKQKQSSQPIELDKFRQLLKEELEQEESQKSALHALIERITAYPDRKREVKFRIGEKVKGTHGGQHTDPTSGHTPYGS